jgi:hypothetical protein
MSSTHSAVSGKRGSDNDFIDEQNLQSWVDHFLLEFQFRNMNLSGYYPHMYGRLNWVKAFGAAGENRCFPRLADMPLAFLTWRLFYLLANFAILVVELSDFYEHGTWFYYFTNWQLITYFAYGFFAFLSAFLIYFGHPSLVKMPVNSTRYLGPVKDLIEANKYLLANPTEDQLRERAKSSRQSKPRASERVVAASSLTGTAGGGGGSGGGGPLVAGSHHDTEQQERDESYHPRDRPGKKPHYAIHVQLAKIAGARCPRELPLPVKITWALQGIAFSYGFWVTFLFWVAVAPFTPVHITGIDNGSAIIPHGIGFLLVLIDFNLNNIPWLLAQSVWSFGYAALYIIWTGIHWYLRLPSRYSSIPGVIYPPVDWYNWPTTLFVGVPLVIIGGPLSNFFVWIIVTRHRSYLGIHGGLPWIDVDGRTADGVIAGRVPRPWWCKCC